MSPYPVPRDPHNPFHERAVGLAMLGCVLFCAVTGLGVGAFVAAPWVGVVAGWALGIAAGVLVVPRLMRDWHD